VIVTGDEYPPSAMNVLIAKVCSYVQMGILIALLFGNKICGALGVPVPGFIATMQESPWMYGLATVFIGSQIQAGLL